MEEGQLFETISTLARLFTTRTDRRECILDSIPILGVRKFLAFLAVVDGCMDFLKFTLVNHNLKFQER